MSDAEQENGGSRRALGQSALVRLIPITPKVSSSLETVTPSGEVELRSERRYRIWVIMNIEYANVSLVQAGFFLTWFYRQGTHESLHTMHGKNNALKRYM